jgi:hypothetical protein
MSQELRQRRTNSDQRPTTSMPSSSASGGLTRSSLLQALPQEHGSVSKLHVPLFYSLLPTTLQKLISRYWFLSFLAPRFERRYLILLGSFLYKFSDNAEQQQPKGSPLPIDMIEVFPLEQKGNSRDFEGVFLNESSMPSGCKSVFCVSTFRKRYYYAVTDREQALLWVNALLEAKQDAIRRSMGHAHEDSYPKSWEYYDRLGQSLRKQKDRIRQRMDEKNLQELEMSQLSDGGPLPRGYHA